MKKIISFLVLLMLVEISFSQPILGTSYKEKLPLLSGKNVSLPPGEWKVTYNTTIQEKGERFKWNAYVLKNTLPEQSVPFVVVRVSDSAVPWSGNNTCTATLPFPVRFFSNTYGTNKNSLISKCSVGFSLRTFPEWLDYKPTTDDIFWKDIVKGFENGKSIKHLLILQEELLIYKSYGVVVSVFVTPPDGLSSNEFVQAYREGNEKKQTPVHQQLTLWAAIYLEAIERSFVHNEFTQLASLNIPNAHSNIHSQTSQLNNDAVPKKDGSINLPLSAPKEQSGSISDSQLKAIKDDNLRLESQLSQLREMFEQLKKANELSNKQAEEQTKNISNDQNKAQVFANRKALVIGNDTYKSIPKLLNAREDAKTIATNLTAFGYQVTLKLDLSEKEMKVALRNFAEQVQGGDEVLFFFAGHGVQLGATNYLLPTDLVGDSEAQVRDEAIQLQRILDDMAERKAKFTLAMIDACRDNPFKTSGRAIGGRGLAPTTAVTGQMIIFSAGSGQQALDKLGNTDKSKNGLFTRVFVQEMQKPNQSVDRVVKNVRNRVAELAKTVGHEQVPAIYDQVLGDFYFQK